MTNPVLTYHPNGRLSSEEWLENGRRHRDSGPALRGWYENGLLRVKYWYQDGKRHRDNSPAYQAWHYNQQLKFEEWFQHGVYHRNDGPARREWHENGEFRYRGWYVKGKAVDEKDHPFPKLLTELNLYNKWKENTLTKEEQLLIKLSLENN